MSLIWQDSVVQVLDNVVRNKNGRKLLYQCRPAIKNRRATSQHILNHNNLTIHDVLQKLRKTVMMVHTVRLDH